MAQEKAKIQFYGESLCPFCQQAVGTFVEALATPGLTASLDFQSKKKKEEATHASRLVLILSHVVVHVLLTTLQQESYTFTTLQC